MVVESVLLAAIEEEQHRVVTEPQLTTATSTTPVPANAFLLRPNLPRPHLKRGW